MLTNIKKLLGEESSKLKKPLLLLMSDALFNMFTYAMLYFVLLDLLRQQLTVERVQWYTVLLAVAFLARLGVNARAYTGMQEQGARAIEKMRLSLGDHIRNINLGFFNKNSIGSLSNIMTNDLQDFEKILTHSTSDVIKALLLSVYLLGITFVIDVQLAVMQLAAVVLAVPILWFGGRRVTVIGQQKKRIMSDLISRMVEYLHGIQVFKAYNLAGAKFSRLEQAFRDFRRECIRTEVAIVPFVLLFQVIVDLSFPCLLLLAVVKFGSGQIDKQALLTFIIINLALINVLRSFGAQYGMVRYLELAAEKLLSVKQEKTQDYCREIVDFDDYSIRFQAVDFAYETGQPVLQNVSFTVPSGTTAALVGPSGSGKTTITSLIARFWDVNSGTITIGGQDIRELQPDALLRHISMVFQDVYLLNDTVYNNIKIGKQTASREEVVAAAKLANCHAFIEKLDQQYDTMIGEGGSTLSGGEKQRISIARAILKDAPIILLDEATASLDADNEADIRQAIKSLTAQKTVLIIAHRLHTIQDADQIIVLNDGKVEEQGSHTALLAHKRHYWQMYREMEAARQWAL